ncbi:phage tail protein [Paenibacillus azoreducens]|uniref:Uncharacterized protein n=1 Tax=Paenibacillus azoreducens TaxID=116718 RepID=A0A920CSB4_9BACL|nr:phage tail protein [Paenibacillus azoreducens]GIO47964.1 hypothetical protein J34TS1_27290 [Paenibacillus azoreducens]
MSSSTPNLGLLKKDPVTDGNETFNIKTMLNENWDKIDAAVKAVEDGLSDIKVPDASLTQKGIVQLSNATDGTRENVAATEKAVKDAALGAKSYTDQQIGLVTETGIPKLVSYPLKVTATSDNQKVFEIPLDLFDANTDTLLISINRATLDSTQYTVTNTVRNVDGKVTQRAKITLLSGVAATSEVTMVVLKNVPIGPDGSINGAVLALNSVPINRVNGLQDQLDLVFQSVSDGKKTVAAAITGKGVQASGSDTFPQLADKIGKISTGTLVELQTSGASQPGPQTGYKSGTLTTLASFTGPVKRVILQSAGVINNNIGDHSRAVWLHSSWGFFGSGSVPVSGQYVKTYLSLSAPGTVGSYLDFTTASSDFDNRGDYDNSWVSALDIDFENKRYRMGVTKKYTSGYIGYDSWISFPAAWKTAAFNTSTPINLLIRYESVEMQANGKAQAYWCGQIFIM